MGQSELSPSPTQLWVCKCIHTQPNPNVEKPLLKIPLLGMDRGQSPFFNAANAIPMWVGSLTVLSQKWTRLKNLGVDPFNGPGIRYMSPIQWIIKSCSVYQKTERSCSIHTQIPLLKCNSVNTSECSLMSIQGWIHRSRVRSWASSLFLLFAY